MYEKIDMCVHCLEMGKNKHKFKNSIDSIIENTKYKNYLNHLVQKSFKILKK